ncbi:MAG: type III-A CRISPR-associated protein Cas10/Csm1 [Bacteroidetes bacterium GWA2_32_17]|nr:MAG: type III-A CRISPR-associated protein Cas10/Csm1 [Bacteroidetes bacterium GWA2_32_17]
MENTDKDNLRKIIYLSALLHDIGKFHYRSQTTKEGEGHEYLGENFIREHFGKIKAFETYKDFLINSSKHHTTPSYVKIADMLVSTEREEEKSKETRRPLLSILSSVKITTENNKQGLFYYYPVVVNQENIFPINEPAINDPENWKYDEQDSIKMHQALLQDFINEIKKIKSINNLNATTYTIYYLLKKYTSKISSASFKSTPDISLFDHLRATAGIVNCFTYHLDEQSLKQYKPANVRKEFYLIKGDITGIQKFIYSDIDLQVAGDSKGLSKRLRGRSFYISLLTDFIAGQFINKLNLYEANILYSGGGHFFITAPYFEGIDDIISNLIEEINLFLFRKTGPRLGLIIGKEKFGEELYINANEAIAKVNHNLNKLKYKKHENYLEEIILNQPGRQDFNNDKIGKNLPYTNYLIEITAINSNDFVKDNDVVAIFESFNIFYFLPDTKPTKKETEEQKIRNFLKERENKIKNCKIIAINNTDFLKHSEKLSDFKFPVSYGFRFIGSYAEINPQTDVCSFEELAKINYRFYLKEEQNEPEKLSYPQLAAIRLDVDNLGGIFGFGLDDKSSFSRIATMSRELDLFFSGYMNVLAEKYKLYITYSGGDDAFLIGSWFNILHFAKELYEKFKEFTCKNQSFSFSSGIFLCDDHFPISRMAEKTAELEERAKDFEKDEKTKNAVTVFDCTLNWDNYCAMIDFAEKLLDYTNEEGTKDKDKLARSLVHRLLRIIKSCLKRNRHVDTDILYKNVAQLHYLFARHGFAADKIENAQKGIEKDIISVILKVFSKEDIVKNYQIPLNYVILKTRKLNK